MKKSSDVSKRDLFEIFMMQDLSGKLIIIAKVVLRKITNKPQGKQNLIMILKYI